MARATKLPSHTITCAVSQVVGELQSMGQEPRISDIAAFLGCTKPTAKKYLDKACWSGKVNKIVKSYRSNASVHVFELGIIGIDKFNSSAWLDAKNAVYAAKGTLI